MKEAIHKHLGTVYLFAILCIRQVECLLTLGVVIVARLCTEWEIAIGVTWEASEPNDEERGWCAEVSCCL